MAGQCSPSGQAPPCALTHCSLAPPRQECEPGFQTSEYLCFMPSSLRPSCLSVSSGGAFSLQAVSVCLGGMAMV